MIKNNKIEVSGKELIAYRNEYGPEKSVVLWALGGLHTLDTEEIKLAARDENELPLTCQIFKSTWTRLVNVIQKSTNYLNPKEGRRASTGNS